MVLTFGYSGVYSLESILARNPKLACTSGTGILPLCAQAAATWRQLEQSASGMTPLAASSVRALASAMITSVLAAAGGRRWCEIAAAPASADTFARLFPQAQFICYHRACAPVICDVTRASRWGLGSTGIGTFGLMYPGNTVAAVATYWADNTRALLDFEAANAARSLRVRNEDLTASPAATMSSILKFLGITQYESCLPDPAAPVLEMAGAGQKATSTGISPEHEVPVDLIPASMLDHVNCLQAKLGYPALV